MPELPEVETVRRTLLPDILHKTIAQVEINYPKALMRINQQEFATNLVNQTIDDIARRGKYLIFKLTDYDLISHLRMEGKYGYTEGQTKKASKYQILRFNFTDQTALIYQDVRKFGKFYLTKKNLADQLPELKKLGVEPTEQDFLVADFYDNLKLHQGMIKPLLLNQELVAGLGNIYVDEVLWQAKIHPEEIASLISKVKVKKLHEAIITTLALATKFLGTTVNTFKNAHGEEGQFQQFLKVYGRTGSPCMRCQTLIEKIKVGGRGTHFCPHCQQKN